MNTREWPEKLAACGFRRSCKQDTKVLFLIVIPAEAGIR